MQSVISQSQQTILQPSHSVLKIGSIERFGGHDWRVLDVQSEKALLLRETIWDTRPYHRPGKAVNWENCTLRKELNDEFCSSILQADRSRIVKSPVTNAKNPWSGAGGGKDTYDYVFLLNIEEVVRYFGDSGQLNRIPKSEFWMNDQYNSTRIAKKADGTASWWWLRSPGNLSDDAANVRNVGTILIYGDSVISVAGGVRPALWLNP